MAVKRYLKYKNQLYKLVDSVNDKIQMRKLASQLDEVIRDVSGYKDTIAYVIDRQINYAKDAKNIAMNSSNVKDLRELEIVVRKSKAMQLAIKRFFDTYSKSK